MYGIPGVPGQFCGIRPLRGMSVAAWKMDSILWALASLEGTRIALRLFVIVKVIVWRGGFGGENAVL